ncbi:PREDICTED: putative pectinesterase/pectinesterase inhibitor 28 [Priapulus caudatus]|uniref:Pectinesterase/pectinesterase inhibitor 28 n=1 Tax=Priapulus caudatus TaxID=37621 RepID=A0ABM1DSI2_PRICU|nr:PREDICTED: putative pectinesterase/pectinesterase inhibitor 28 [Priapulus caudatus]
MSARNNPQCEMNGQPTAPLYAPHPGSVDGGNRSNAPLSCTYYVIQRMLGALAGAATINAQQPAQPTTPSSSPPSPPAAGPTLPPSSSTTITPSSSTTITPS